MNFRLSPIPLSENVECSVFNHAQEGKCVLCKDGSSVENAQVGSLSYPQNCSKDSLPFLDKNLCTSATPQTCNSRKRFKITPQELELSPTSSFSNYKSIAANRRKFAAERKRTNFVPILPRVHSSLNRRQADYYASELDGISRHQSDDICENRIPTSGFVTLNDQLPLSVPSSRAVSSNDISEEPCTINSCSQAFDQKIQSTSDLSGSSPMSVACCSQVDSPMTRPGFILSPDRSGPVALCIPVCHFGVPINASAMIPYWQSFSPTVASHSVEDLFPGLLNQPVLYRIPYNPWPLNQNVIDDQQFAYNSQSPLLQTSPGSNERNSSSQHSFSRIVTCESTSSMGKGRDTPSDILDVADTFRSSSCQLDCQRFGCSLKPGFQTSRYLAPSTCQQELVLKDISTFANTSSCESSRNLRGNTSKMDILDAAEKHFASSGDMSMCNSNHALNSTPISSSSSSSEKRNKDPDCTTITSDACMSTVSSTSSEDSKSPVHSDGKGGTSTIASDSETSDLCRPKDIIDCCCASPNDGLGESSAAEFKRPISSHLPRLPKTEESLQDKMYSARQNEIRNEAESDDDVVDMGVLFKKVTSRMDSDLSKIIQEIKDEESGIVHPQKDQVVVDVAADILRRFPSTFLQDLFEDPSNLNQESFVDAYTAALASDC